MAKKSFVVENPINNSPSKSFLSQNQDEKEKEKRCSMSLRLKPKNMEYVAIISKLKGISRNKFINDLIADNEKIHIQEYLEAKNLINKMENK